MIHVENRPTYLYRKEISHVFFGFCWRFDSISLNLQSHLPFRYLPNAIKRHGRIIHVSRNPKDTAVSLYCMLKKLTFMFSNFSGSFHALLQCIFYSDKCKLSHLWLIFFLKKTHALLIQNKNIHFSVAYGNWFDFVKEWDKVMCQENRGCKILHLEFEEMKKVSWSVISSCVIHHSLPDPSPEKQIVK